MVVDIGEGVTQCVPVFDGKFMLLSFFEMVFIIKEVGREPIKSWVRILLLCACGPGYLEASSLKRSDFGGEELQMYLQKILCDMGYAMTTRDDFVRPICLYVYVCICIHTGGFYTCVGNASTFGDMLTCISLSLLLHSSAGVSQCNQMLNPPTSLYICPRVRIPSSFAPSQRPRLSICIVFMRHVDDYVKA